MFSQILSFRVLFVFKEFFILFLNEKVGCNSRYLDLEDRLDTEILISFRDSSLSLLYIILLFQDLLRYFYSGIL